jgi:hypothetical protein
MNRKGHEDARFFIGTEVEHTPALGLKTLFVVGVQPIADVIVMWSDPSNNVDCPISHIYFGANMSFPNPPVNDFHTWQAWEEMIKPCLDTGVLCTLDVDSTCVEGLVESGLTEYNNFIPMISVKLPYMSQLGYNATIKLDDKDFAATNPGVWCHNLHDLQNRDRYTAWSKYTKDKVIA